jgi:hypothetical protein
MSKTKKGDKMKTTYALPKDITKADLKYPSYKQAVYLDSFRDLTGSSGFEIWYTERFGWVIPTLFIHGARRMQNSHRTYGVSITDKQLVRVGSGPHVLEKHTIHFSKKNKKRLIKAFETTIREGAIEAHDCRDRISTRRAQSRRNSYSFGF